MIQSGLFCVNLSQHVTHPGPDMYPISFTLAALFAMALEARAEGFVPVTDRDTFIELVSTRELRHPFGIRLIVSPDGQISGNAMGWPVSGTWNWTDGFFCREMEWSGTPIPFNCQLVEVEAGRKLRFTVDRGAGDSATFRLQ